ncbi:hypothetical protein BX600DRAFT_517537 [Xylariales sp. PMI_506]|nr:hypothetical protein BX600DRAFT_517537 [Xylariales sp. PMI_506]
MALSLESNTALSAGSKDLLTSVLEAHGGIERWNNVASIEVTLNFSGAALARKGYPGRYQPTFTIDTKETKVDIQGIGRDNRGSRLFYTPRRVWIERPDGTVTASRDNPYEAFADHEFGTPWDDLHLACFVGYAFHNYLTFPFQLTWPGFENREVDPHNENGETWRVLEVTFPASYPAHNKVQLFYFDQDFMLRRVDYAPLAMKVPASHYCYDVREFDGIKIPTLRRVVGRKPDSPMVNGQYALRGWTQLGGPSAFLMDYINVVIRDGDT